MGVEGDAGKDRREGWGEEGRAVVRGQGCGEGGAGGRGRRRNAGRAEREKGQGPQEAGRDFPPKKAAPG